MRERNNSAERGIAEEAIHCGSPWLRLSAFGTTMVASVLYTTDSPSSTRASSTRNALYCNCTGYLDMVSICLCTIDIRVSKAVLGFLLCTSSASFSFSFFLFLFLLCFSEASWAPCSLCCRVCLGASVELNKRLSRDAALDAAEQASFTLHCAEGRHRCRDHFACGAPVRGAGMYRRRRCCRRRFPPFCLLHQIPVVPPHFRLDYCGHDQADVGQTSEQLVVLFSLVVATLTRSGTTTAPFPTPFSQSRAWATWSSFSTDPELQSEWLASRSGHRQ